MARRRKPAKERPAPGGPGAMAALRRAQEKLKALGIKPWKPAAPPAPKEKPAPLPAKKPDAVKRTSIAKAVSAARKAPAKGRR